MLLLKIMGGLVALAVGIWLGRPGRPPSASEIDKVMDQPGRRRRRATRHFTPADWFKRQKRAPDRLSRHRFHLEAPEEAGEDARGEGRAVAPQRSR